MSASLAEAAPPTPSSARAHPAILAAASAGLLWLAFPPVDRGYLGWAALAPFFLLVRSDRRPLPLYLGAWVGGLVFGLLSMAWVGRASWVGMALMALFLSLWWPLFLLPARLGVRRLGLPLAVVAPVVWVALEYARANILSGFPWYYLAHTQYRYLAIIQVADLAGAWGLSLVVAASNAALVDLLRHARTAPPGRWAWGQAAGVAVVAAAVMVYGNARLGSGGFVDGPRVALLQTNFPQILGNGPRFDVVIQTMDGLLAKALKASPPPDLIVWPETSYPIGVVKIDPALTESEFAALARRLDPESKPEDWWDRQARGLADLHGIADSAQVPMVVGTATYDFAPGGVDRYNSAVLFRPGISEATDYHKQTLVPFGEYIPFVRIFPWVLALTPYEDGYVPGLSPGRGPNALEVGGVRYAPLICFEDTMPAVARGFFADPSRPPPDVLLNLTNDGWFWGTSEPSVHLAISAFRAVECRAPLIRSVNSGVSALIDGDGRIRETLPSETVGVLDALVPLDPRGSLYLLGGDWLPMLCGIASGLFLIGGFRPRHPSLLAHPASVG